MSKWPTTKISDICTRIAMGPFGSNIKVDNFVPSGVPVLNGANLAGFKLKEDSFNYVTEHKAEELKNSLAYRGDIVVTHRGTLGQIVYIPSDSRFDKYLISQSQFLLRVDSDKADSRFITYFFHSVYGQYLLLSNASQVGVPALARPTSTFKSLEIPLPPLRIQKKIADFLCLLDKKVQLNAQINRNLEQQAQMVFERLLCSGNGEATLDSVAAINPPRSLKKGCLARCIDMTQLSTSQSFPQLGTIKPYSGGMKFKNGDTIFARITPCLENGKTAYIDFLEEDEVAFGSTEYIVMSSRGKMPSPFFYCLARHKDFIEYATKRMNGSSGRQRVSGDAIASFPIPCFPDDALCEFSKTTLPVFNVIKNNSIENLRLATLRDTLLPKLMSGEIDVSEVEV